MPGTHSTRTVAEIALRGAGGEPVDLRRSLRSHGLLELPPMRLDEERDALELPLRAGGRPRMVRISPGRRGRARVEVLGPTPGPRRMAALLAEVRAVLRLDLDLSGFYALLDGDPLLSWAASGAGRMVRSPTVFEDVVKTICTTNCAWSATRRMVSALVEHLGEPAVGLRPDGAWGRAFPTPEAMAGRDERFYREVVRAGYRAGPLLGLARAVAEGRLDLEAWGRARPEELPDDELERRLLALPGIGPYAAAHVMLLLGRSSRLILDSWSRPTYARLVGRRSLTDAQIVRRFRRYGPYAGLAFWLVLTRDWLDG